MVIGPEKVVPILEVQLDDFNLFLIISGDPKSAIGMSFNMSIFFEILLGLS